MTVLWTCKVCVVVGVALQHMGVQDVLGTKMRSD